MKISTSQRINEIAKMLEKDGYVKAKDLASQYQVSMETIRKDLTFLEEKGLAKKEYGGAVLNTLGIEKSYDFRKHKEDEKKEIGRYVAEIVNQYQTILLDSGSTCASCCEYINMLPTKDIFTNSIVAFELLDGEHHNVFLLPGKKREKDQSVIGTWTEDYIAQIQVDVCILGTAGMLESLGPTCHSYQGMATKKKMIEKSDYVYVVADNSKFNEKGLYTVTTWDHVDGLITDQHISPQMYEKYKNLVPIYIMEEGKSQ